eukprot:764167-Karenia_brevis.AAC.1
MDISNTDGHLKHRRLTTHTHSQLNTRRLHAFMLHGLNERYATRDYFGYGNYFSDDFEKADKYVEPQSDP